MIPLMAVADTHIANCANTRDTRNCIPGLCAPSATPTLSMAKRRTKSRGNRRTKTKARQGRKDDGSKPDRSSRDRAQANHQSDAPHHHTKHRSSDASRTSGKQDNKSDSSSSDDGVHVGRWLCCYLPLFFVAFTSIGQIVLEDIVAPDEEMVLYTTRATSTAQCYAVLTRCAVPCSAPEPAQCGPD